MPVVLRYWLVQIPELLLVGALAAGAAWLDFLDWYWVPGAVWACAVKDAVLYPWLKHSYSVRPSGLVGPERLLGSRGVAVEDLAPAGFVRVSAELWRARTADGAPLARGARVRVEGLEGMGLVVARVPEEPPAASSDRPRTDVPGAQRS
jgi:membrane protein implicated in regulation of membrane protease activity